MCYAVMYCEKTCFLGSVSHKFASHYWTCHINPENVWICLLATRLVRLVVHIRTFMNPPYIMWTDVYNSYTYSNIFFLNEYGNSYAVSELYLVQAKQSCSCGTSSQAQIWIIAIFYFIFTNILVAFDFF